MSSSNKIEEFKIKRLFWIIFGLLTFVIISAFIIVLFDFITWIIIVMIGIVILLLVAVALDA